MQQELHMAPAGLFTDPHASKAPPGALRIAQNVVIRRDGIIQPRPGFEYNKATYGTEDIYRAISFKGDIVLYTSKPTLRWHSNASEILNEAGAALSPIAGEFRGCESRNNLYLPFSDGVRKLTGALDAVAENAGAPSTGSFEAGTASAGTAIANNSIVRYRAVIKRTDNNGVIVRGVPSSSMMYINDSGGAVNLGVALWLSGIEKVGDIAELYRSANYPSTAIPDEELGLVAQHVITSDDIATGAFGFQDTNAADDLGALIYTAPSQEGALQENNRPPKCTDMALFKSSVFFANTEGLQRVILNIKQASDASQTGDATGIGRRTATGDLYSGSYTILNVTPTTGLAIGQLVIAADDFELITFITNISGSTVTVSGYSTRTVVGTTITFDDTMFVGTPSSYRTITCRFGCADRIVVDLCNPPSSYYARSLSDYKYNSSGFVYDGSNGMLVINQKTLGASKFYIWGTHGEAYFPNLTGPTGYAGGLLTGLTTANGIGSTSDDCQNRIMWSKPDQPEHVPEVNYSPVGSENHPILRIIPTRDALFIFKTDGIWRLTGAGAYSGWRIDEFDLSTILLRADAAVEMDNAIYAWTNKGLVRVTDEGVSLISATAIGNLLQYREYMVHSSTTNYSNVYITKNPKDNEIILSAEISATNKTLYIFNTKTLAWYTWVMDFVDSLFHVLCNESDRLLYMFYLSEGTTTRAAIKERKTSLLQMIAVDMDFTVNIVSASGVDIVISAGSGYTPVRGDCFAVIYLGFFVITKVTDATHFQVDRPCVATGNRLFFMGINSVIEWVAKTGGNEGAVKHYTEGGYAFNEFSGLYEINYSFLSSLSTVAVSYIEAFPEFQLPLSTATSSPKTARFIVPSAHARTAYLYPKISIRQALCAWELSGLSLYFKGLRGRALSRGTTTPAAI